MSRLRISDFDVINPFYEDAVVTFYTVVAGVKTTAKATLYRDTTSLSTHPNPITLNSFGRFSAAVYVEESVIATILAAAAVSHDTGIIYSSSDAAAALRADLLSTGNTELGVSIVGQSIQIVSSVAVLKTIPVSNTRFIQALGYYAPGDGGGGIFYGNTASAATANDGTVIAPNAGPGRWLRNYEDKINVKWFGASPASSAAVNTTAFNGALDIGIAVFVPGVDVAAGEKYNLNALAQVTKPNPTIYGTGRHSLLAFDTVGNGMDFDPGNAQQRRGLVVRDLAFDNATNVPASFIKCTDHVNTVFERLYFADCAATWCVDHVGSYGTRFRDCVFADVTGGGVRLRDDGGITSFSLLTRFDGCDFTRISGDGISSEGGAFLSINDTVLESIVGGALKFRSGLASIEAWAATLNNVWFENNTGTDIDMPSDVNYWCTATLTGCSFIGTPTIALGAKSKITIIGTDNSGGHICTVSGSANAEVQLINSGGFTQSGTFRWIDTRQSPPSWTMGWAGAGAQSTGLNVNASTGGKTLLFLLSRQTGAGNSTASALYMVRFGYDGDNMTATAVSQDIGGTGGGGATFTFSVVASILNIAGPGAGNYFAQILVNR